MNWNPAEASLKQLTASLRRRWDKLIDGQLHLWEGKRDRPKQVAGTQAARQEIEPPT